MNSNATQNTTSSNAGNRQISVLVVYDTNSGNSYRMAQLIGRGVESVNHCTATIRTVPKVGDRTAERIAAVPDQGAPYVQLDDLPASDALILGGPTHFGNMSASLKYFLDQTTEQWFRGALANKPAGVFTSTGSMHGGQETTLLTMMIPLMHHGMIMCGLPYSNPELMQTQGGGTPYGASHVSGEAGDNAVSDMEAKLCKALGARIASFAVKLKA